MTKGLMLAMTVIAFALEPTATEPDLVKYAVTQGGLLAVVLVLLWTYRKDSLGALQTERDRLGELVDLVASTREALTKSTDTIAMQAKAIENLTSVVTKIDERRERR